MTHMNEKRRRALGDVIRAMRSSIPVNKGSAVASSRPRRLPQLENPVLIGAIGLGLVGVGAAVRNLRPGRRDTSRQARVRASVLAGLAENGPGGEPVGGIAPGDMSIEIHEAFGKPALVTVDVRVDEDGFGGHTVSAGGDALVNDLLDRVSEAVWNNPVVAPVAVRGQILAKDADGAETPTAAAPSGENAAEGHGEPSVRVLADMRALGFDDETARPADLFDRYGPPASDPTWKP